MKKTTILNAALSYQIARLGHTQGLCICDAGLPVPSSVELIDLALCAGLPSFIDSLQTVVTEMFVERVLLAEEIKTRNPAILAAILSTLKQLELRQGNHIQIDFISHESFKQNSIQTNVVVRTGECTPYANIILYSGVPF